MDAHHVPRRRSGGILFRPPASAGPSARRLTICSERMSKCHIDTFVRDRLPPAEQQPEFLFELPELNYPGRLTDTGKLQRFVLREG